MDSDTDANAAMGAAYTLGSDRYRHAKTHEDALSADRYRHPYPHADTRRADFPRSPGYHCRP